MDVKNIFLHGDLHEVYMSPPPRFVVKNRKENCLLKKSLYGLKRCRRAWFDRFSSVIIKFGFQRCNVDHTMFVTHRGMRVAIHVVYVDDIVVMGQDGDEINRLKAYMKSKVKIKDLGNLRYFLHVEVGKSKHSICISKSQNISIPWFSLKQQEN